MNTLEILKTARNRLAIPGQWGKGRRGPFGTRPLTTCCATEAIEDSSLTIDDIFEIKQTFKLIQYCAGCKSIIDWNDAPERTLEDVLKVFDLAIAIAKG